MTSTAAPHFAPRHFFSAAFNGELSSLRRMLASDPSLGALAGPNGQTALHFAAHGDHPKAIEMLLPHCDPNRPNDAQETPLMVAVRFGSFASAKALAPKSDPEAVDREGNTALMKAAFEGEADCLRLLATRDGAKKRNEKGQTALIIACKRELWDCAKALLPFSDAMECDAQGQTALWHAIVCEKWDFADLLAANMSTGYARELRYLAPEDADLPLSRALIERDELAKAMAQAPMPQGQSTDAPKEPRAARRV